jgi:hypothetical protein
MFLDQSSISDFIIWSLRRVLIVGANIQDQVTRWVWLWLSSDSWFIYFSGVYLLWPLINKWVEEKAVTNRTKGEWGRKWSTSWFEQRMAWTTSPTLNTLPIQPYGHCESTGYGMLAFPQLFPSCQPLWSTFWAGGNFWLPWKEPAGKGSLTCSLSGSSAVQTWVVPKWPETSKDKAARWCGLSYLIKNNVVFFFPGKGYILWRSFYV